MRREYYWMISKYVKEQKWYTQDELRKIFEFNDKYGDEYEALVQQGDVKSLPIEYYDITWTTFARDVITTRSIPYKSSLIDSSEYRYQSGNVLMMLWTQGHLRLARVIIITTL